MTGALVRSCVVMLGLALGCMALAVTGQEHRHRALQDRRFPDDFLFGVATAAHQIEGGWDADDKGENIWDRMTHTKPWVIKDGTNGDIAADSYHNYKRDVEMMRELGLDAYRFSLSWSRILPDGFSYRVSDAGVDFYNNLIDELLKYNIKPMVTLYHWDLPQKLQDLGGFTSPLFPIWFEDYARVVYEKFGDRVKNWITFNEPREICYEGYGAATKAPVLNATGIGNYLCAKYLLLGHAKAYHLYNNEFKASQGGECGITISVNSFEPLTQTEADVFANELRRQVEWKMFAHPIFSEEGDWPIELMERVAQKSKEQGFRWSRMPSFTEEEITLIKGSSDFFGVNHYTGYFTSATEYLSEHPVPSLLDDIGVGSYVPDEWVKSASPWLTRSPGSLIAVLSFLNDAYNKPTFYITENGWSTYPSGGFHDDERIEYLRLVMEQCLDALDMDIDLKGYMHWSLMDNFEWMEGLTERFGLYQVDFEDPARPRTPRKSAFFYKEVIKSRENINDYYSGPASPVMTIDDGR